MPNAKEIYDKRVQALDESLKQDKVDKNKIEARKSKVEDKIKKLEGLADNYKLLLELRNPFPTKDKNNFGDIIYIGRNLEAYPETDAPMILNIVDI